MKPPHLFLIAGEPSGDLLGAALIRGLRELCGPALNLEGVGGPSMREVGFESRFPMEELSVMGIAEVLPRLPNLLKRIRETSEAVIAAEPDALITIDSPDFCLRVAKRARKALPGLKVIHYVAPSVWAWRPSRAQKMARSVTHVLALLPFEPPYMQAAGMTCDFVGHPVVQTPIIRSAEIAELRQALDIAPGRQVLVVLPGSRRSEVRRLAPVFREVVDRLRLERPDLAVVIPAVGPVTELIEAHFGTGQDAAAIILKASDVPSDRVERRKQTAFAMADAALAASGTVSLELAAQATPMVIAYGANPVTSAIARRLIKLDSVTLVNLVTETVAVPEFLLENCRPELIAPAVSRLLSDPDAAVQQRIAADDALDRLGRGGEDPGLRAARSVMNIVVSRDH
ncbi:MAG: lipid-A-disaccharide synthase [Pseudomonadota bacterium]